MGSEIDRIEVQVKASAKEANSQLDKLVNKLDKLQNVISSIGNVTNLNGLKSGIKGINANFNILSYSSNKLIKSTNSLTASFAKMYVGLNALKKGFGSLKDSISKSVDYVEVLNYFDAAFGQVANSAVSQWEDAGYDSAEAYYNSFSSRAKELTSKMTGFNVNDDGTLTATGNASLGINPTKLMNYQATFAQMSNSIGITAETSLMLSQALTEVGADLASVKNMDFDKVWKDMASGLAGMSRTMDKYGVNIRNVNLQQKLFDLGINENITNLNQNDKALLRAIILLDSTRYAWGDLADTLNQPANQMRLLDSNLNNLSRTIGNLFLPIVSKVLPYVNGLVIGLQRLFTWVGNLLGIDISGITSAVGDGAFDIGELVDETDDLAGSLGDATKAAEKLKRGIRGFDELNVITTQTDSSSALSGTGLPSGLLDDAFSNAFSEYQKAWDEAFANMENRANEFADKVEKFLQPVRDIIEDFAIGDFFKAGQDTSNLVAGIFNFFANAIDNVDWYGIGTKIGEFLEGVNWLEIFKSTGNLMWQGLKAAFELAIGSFSVAPIETSLLGLLALPAIVGFGSKLITFIATPFTKLAGIIRPVISWIGGLFAEGGIFGAGGAIATASAPVIALVTAFAALAAGLGYVFATNEEVRESFFQAISAIKEGLQPALEFLTGTLLPDLKAGWERLVEILTPLGEFLSGAFTSIWQDMINPALTYIGENVLPKVAEAFENLWNNVLVPLGNLLGDILAPVIKIVSDGLSVLWKNVVVPLADAIGSILAPAFDAVIDIFGWLTEKIEPVIDVLQYLWDNVLAPTVDHLWNEFKPVFEDVFEAVGGVIDGLGDALGGLIDFVSGVFTTDWEKAWKGVKEIFGGIFNGLISIVEGSINIIIDGLNGFLGKFDGVVTSIGDVIGIDISIPEIPKVDLPKFQLGGFPEDGLFMANHNELVGKFSNGKTAVANNQQITDGIAIAVQNANSEQNQLLRQQNELLLAILQKPTIGNDDVFNAARAVYKDKAIRKYGSSSAYDPVWG